MTVRFTLLLAGVAALLSAALAPAQSPLPIVTAPAMAFPSNDPVEALGRYLRVLALFPRNLDALSGAGRSSLAIGDANAAISFFARAQEIAPGDGRIKAGLASALVQMEQPKTALKLFDQAVALGVPEADIASDRGLARDLRGDTRRAQADYALALRGRPDDETTRRLAVSQAISGDRAAAMATLDALLRRQDRAAWRIRAFVLALTGDRDGAELAARNAMPLPQAQALTPFFARLPGLRPGEKAAAVHLGQFPSDGRSSGNSALFAQADNAASPMPPPGPRSDVPLIPAGAPLGTPASASLSEALSRAPRRRPGSIDAAPAAAAPALGSSATASSGYPPPAAAGPPVRPLAPLAPMQAIVPPQAAAVPPRPAAAPIPAAVARAPAAVPIIAAPIRSAAIPTLPAAAPPTIAAPVPAPQVAVGGPSDITPAAVIASDASAPIVATPYGPALASAASVPTAPVKLAAIEPARPAAPAPQPAKEAAPPKPKPAAKADEPPAGERQVRVNGKEKVADAPHPAKRNAKGKPADAEDAKAKERPSAKEAKAAKAAKEKLAAKDAKDSKAAKDAAKAKEAEKDKPSEAAGGERYWVQVASGANKSDLGRAWEKTKTRAPKLLDGRPTYTSPWKASNRLLVGPFKTDEEAQGFVNTLAKSGMVGMQFTSRGKTKVERLSGN